MHFYTVKKQIEAKAIHGPLFHITGRFRGGTDKQVAHTPPGYQ